MQFCGLDASLTAVIDARTRHSRIPFVVGDAFEAPFAANSQDAIMLMNIWEHVTDPVSMAKSLRKVLKPEGVLVVTTPSRFRTENILRALRGRDVSFRSVQHVTEYTVGQVFEQLRWAGFDVVEHHGEPMPQPEGAFLQKLRRATLGAALDGWRKATGSHHSFGPTVFFVARQTR
jgi:SAM-dependent methyltransferase